MRARATVVAEADGRGGTRLARVRSEAPLVLRNTPGALYLVSGAAGPLGGDDLTMDLDVGRAARLTVRTAAASVALPGRGPSSVRMAVRVAGSGELRWLPEPVVAAGACRHRMEAAIVLEPGARLVWREELVLGRHGELPGSVASRLVVHVGGAPLLRQEVALGPDHPESVTPAVAGDARYLGSVLVVDPAWSSPPGPIVLGPGAAVLPLAGPAVQIVAVGDDALGLRRELDRGMGAVDAVSV